MSQLPYGIYERLITPDLRRALDHLPATAHYNADEVDAADIPSVLARYLHDAVLRRLHTVRGDDAAQRQVDLANAVLSLLARTDGRDAAGAVDAEDVVENGPLQLLSVSPQSLDGNHAPRPAIPLSASALLVNGPRDHSIGTAVCSELESADRVDLLCSFLKWTGLRIVRDALLRFLARGGQMRVITTCYLGATDRRVLDDLVRIGADACPSDNAVRVKVSYDTRRTRLHAKAWLFERATGFSTGCIGSSNLSTNALVDGVEWNVRVSGVDTPHILQKFRGTFESYWNSPDFEDYDPDRDAERFDRASRLEAAGTRDDSAGGWFVDVRPYPFQREILERLETEREVHHRYRNLVVAATGTGKTMIAAFDYARLRAQRGNTRDRLLFVAHREHILRQAHDCFRLVLRDSRFGEVMVGGKRPVDARHVFASIQTLSQQNLEELPPDAYDVVIVDEFHHAAAPTYHRLLEHLRPAVLLGLTATPERADGVSVLHWFDHRIAAQLRLWHALERGLLCPFQYFGVADPVSLREVPWKRGAYDTTRLDNLYTGNHARAARIFEALGRHLLDPQRMRAIGFCVSVNHARAMANDFTRRGLPSRSVTGDTPVPEREEAVRALKRGEVNALFTVDVFGEGVDIPEVDTVLLLRPTESATVFCQQLGRGLRLHEGKPCLTVLDFIGLARREFRFDLRFAALLPGTRAEVRRQVEEGFPFLPSGCAIRLEREARDVVLENLRTALVQSRRWLVEELRGTGPLPLREFVKRAEIELRDIYGADRTRSWTSLRREAGVLGDPPTPDAAHPRADGAAGTGFAPDADEVAGTGGAPDADGADAARRLGTLRGLVHVDDEERLEFYRNVTTGKVDVRAWSVRQRRLWAMLHVSLFAGKRLTAEEGVRALSDDQMLREELLELLDTLDDRAEEMTWPLHDLRGLADAPLRVHGTYTLDEIMAAFGRMGPDGGTRIREGVMHVSPGGHDALFVTLQKSEKQYSPTTMYRDHAISPSRFHWESQSTTRAESATGLRYQSHGRKTGTHALLFVRDTIKGQYGSTSPYTFAGPADFVSAQGERPMGIVWALHHELSASTFERARVVA